MNYLRLVQDVIDYIEDNLTSDISLKDLAEQANFSLYHFHKIFQAVTQNSLKEYIRKRRLTEAAKELIDTDKRIIDLAFEYQYQSQAAFTRAFKKVFGTTPGRYRRKQEHYLLLRREELTEIKLNHLKEGISLEPKIMVKDEFKVIGLEYYGDNQNNEIPELWGRFIERIGEVKNRIRPDRTLGLCEHVPTLTNESEFRYLACAEVDSLIHIPADFVGEIVPREQYAVFTHKGPANDLLEQTYQYIHGNWFLTSGYEPTGSHDFELYDQRFTNDKDSEMEIYIPVKKIK